MLQSLPGTLLLISRAAPRAAPRAVPRAVALVVLFCMVTSLGMTAPPEIEQAPPLPPPVEPVVVTESAWLAVDADTGDARLTEQPTDLQLFTGRFHYDGGQPVIGLRIVLPIPTGTHYVADSATGPGADISFSADGGRTFAEPNALTVAVVPAEHASAARRAEPEEYTHIRWDLAGEYSAGTRGLVSFRARPVAPDPAAPGPPAAGAGP